LRALNLVLCTGDIFEKPNLNNVAAKLLVTTISGKWERCVHEVANCVMPFDGEAQVLPISPNVIIVKSKLAPDEVYGLVRAWPPSCVARAYPIHAAAPLNEKAAIEAALDLLRAKSGRFFVDCRNRGGKIDCREVEMGIGMTLNERIDYRNPEWIIAINCADLCYVSLIRRGQEKFRSSLPMPI